MAAWLSCTDEHGRKRAPRIANFREGRIIRITAADAWQFIAQHTVRNGMADKLNLARRNDPHLDWARIERLIETAVAARLEAARREWLAAPPEVARRLGSVERYLAAQPANQAKGHE